MNILDLPLEVLLEIISLDLLSTADRCSIRLTNRALGSVVAMKPFMRPSFAFCQRLGGRRKNVKASSTKPTVTQELQRFLSESNSGAWALVKSVSISFWFPRGPRSRAAWSSPIRLDCSGLGSFGSDTFRQIVRKTSVSEVFLELDDYGLRYGSYPGKDRTANSRNMKRLLISMGVCGLATSVVLKLRVSNGSNVLPHLSNLTSLEVQWDWFFRRQGAPNFDVHRRIAAVIARSPGLKDLKLTSKRIDVIHLDSVLDAVPSNHPISIQNLEFDFVSTSLKAINAARLKRLRSLKMNDQTFCESPPVSAYHWSEMWRAFSSAGVALHNLTAHVRQGPQRFPAYDISHVLDYLISDIGSQISNLAIRFCEGEDFAPCSNLDLEQSVCIHGRRFWAEVFPTIRYTIQHLTLSLDERNCLGAYSSNLQATKIFLLKRGMATITPPEPLSSPSLRFLSLPGIYNEGLVDDVMRKISNCPQLRQVKIRAMDYKRYNPDTFLGSKAAKDGIPYKSRCLHSDDHPWEGQGGDWNDLLELTLEVCKFARGVWNAPWLLVGRRMKFEWTPGGNFRTRKVQLLPDEILQPPR